MDEMCSDLIEIWSRPSAMPVRLRQWQRFDITLSPVFCFMDMRAPQILQPSEREQFRFVVFGGILGDHPPQDRAKEFRETFSHIRQLGNVQMTTDTAVLVSHEILG